MLGFYLQAKTMGLVVDGLIGKSICNYVDEEDININSITVGVLFDSEKVSDL